MSANPWEVGQVADPFTDDEGELGLVFGARSYPRLPPWSRTIGNPNDVPPAQLGAWRVGALIVTEEEKNAMQAQVRQFENDVELIAGPSTPGPVQQLEPGIEDVFADLAMRTCKGLALTWDKTNRICTNVPDPTLASYPPWAFDPKLRQFRESRLEPFVTDWEFFLTGFGSSIGVADFETLKLRFADLVDEWRSLGQTTSAQPPAVKNPDSAFQTAAAWLPWAVGGAAVLGLLYLGWPAIGAALARR